MRTMGRHFLSVISLGALILSVDIGWRSFTPGGSKIFTFTNGSSWVSLNEKPNYSHSPQMFSLSFERGVPRDMELPDPTSETSQPFLGICFGKGTSSYSPTFNYGGSVVSYVQIKAWYVLAPCQLPIFMFFKRFLAERRRAKLIRNGLCPSCGYDWSQSARSCSECGQKKILSREYFS